jgi:hypothetical protein
MAPHFSLALGWDLQESVQPIAAIAKDDPRWSRRRSARLLVAHGEAGAPPAAGALLPC